jgi:dTDP-4-dehydrorhamnose 3,5-epimerase
MRFRPTRLSGAYLVELEPRVDERGFFARVFADEEFAALGLPSSFPHCNLSRNTRAGTLRGMHYNSAPFREAKLVRCVSGAIWDAIVDLRPDSATRLRWFGVELSAERGDALFVPEGFAHGFITLCDGTDVFYHMSRPYEPKAARGLRWNDPRLAIEWPRTPVVMSPRDRDLPDFDDATFDG